MDSVRSITKVALAVAVIGVFLGVAFVFGYQVGSAPDDSTPTMINNNEESRSSELVPTATETPVAETETVVLPTDTVSASDTPAAQTPKPDSTVTPPAPVSEGESESAAPAPVATEEPVLSDEEALSVLREVWNLVNEEFFGELPTPEDRAYGAIRGMLDTLSDDYTSFSEPNIAEIRREDASGSFEGIGAFVTMNDDDILEIVQAFEGSPAEGAGLRQGDKIIAVDDESISGYSIYEAITLIRGPEGSEVVLSVQRGDEEPFEVTLVRARLDIPVLESEMLESNIGYISLFDFSNQATDRLQEAIEQLLDQGATSLIFDLRGNPGGFLDQAVNVSDLFLDEGLILIERRSDGEEIEFKSSDKGLAQDIPMVVLVNGGSASASEIVAGAIQDRGRAVLIGETTFGKGSVQLLHTLSDGSELRVTVARWFTPNDNAIHGEGLTPDIEVPMTPEDLEADLDPQLDRAIEYLTTGQ
jgi:carboxyl-terminal processing protease